MPHWCRRDVNRCGYDDAAGVDVNRYDGYDGYDDDAAGMMWGVWSPIDAMIDVMSGAAPCIH